MDIESQKLELKVDVKNFREISIPTCAFANAIGGTIKLGVADDGKIVGIQEKDLDQLQQRVEGAIQQVSPVPFHRIKIEEIDGKKILTIDIYQAGDNSFCTFNGVTYYLNGSVNAKLEGQSLQEYLTKRRIILFDEKVSNAQIRDLDPVKVIEFLKKRNPNLVFQTEKIKEYLVNLGL